MEQSMGSALPNSPTHRPAEMNASAADRPDEHRSRRRALGFRLVAAATVSLLTALNVSAAECPSLPAPQLPPVSSPLNLDTVKSSLRKYHNDSYMHDIAAVFSVAQSFVESHYAEAKKPAVVLDIDETSLSNWTNLDFDDFGFIQKGPCSERKGFACGFKSWVAKSTAGVIRPARDFYNAIHAKHIAIFFITGRTNSQRAATVRNLHRAGFHRWTGLATRPDDDKNSSIVPFKSGERAKIVQKGYTILANVGDQQSDLDGGAAECGFKLPNPFYFIP
jgi:acid phosphatase